MVTKKQLEKELSMAREESAHYQERVKYLRVVLDAATKKRAELQAEVAELKESIKELKHSKAKDDDPYEGFTAAIAYSCTPGVSVSTNTVNPYTVTVGTSKINQEFYGKLITIIPRISDLYGTGDKGRLDFIADVEKSYEHLQGQVALDTTRLLNLSDEEYKEETNGDS